VGDRSITLTPIEYERTDLYRLRTKPERDSHQPEHLRNRPGVGYFFAEPANAA
jgi:hypothetical protein